MKQIILLINCIIISLYSVAQYNGYALSSAGIRIYDASASVLSEINKIDGKEKRLVQLGAETSQSDFDNICAKLKWIQKFSIEKTTDITDWSSLKKLKDLEYLKIDNGSHPTDDSVSLASLAELTSLKEIHILGKRVTDTEVISTLTELESVSFVNTQLASLGFLSQIKGLKKLTLSGTNHTFTNYDTLRKLNQLTTLDVSYNPQATADNLDVFSDVSTLTKVDVSYCENLKSLGFLYGSTGKLQEFYAVGCTNIGNFDMLIRCQKLKKVDISNSSAKNVKFLVNKLYIKDLRLSHTEVSSISELAQSIELERLDVSYTQVDSINFLHNMTKLKRLNISHSNITDVSALSGCTALIDFDCSNTPLSSIAGMDQCINLTKINIGHTMISDLTPFYSAKKIKSIIINEHIQPAELEALKRRSPLIIIDVAN